MDPSIIITQTKKWITDIVIGCNFCPFAAREIKRDSVHYSIETNDDTETCLQHLLQLCEQMDNDPAIETSFLILPGSFSNFTDYLDLVSIAEQLMKSRRYEGVYQLASFHPAYLFEGSDEEDAANYTNRSPYPMLHILREESIEKALEKYPDPESIPGKNIEFARKKGIAYMKMLRDTCFEG